MATNKRPDYTAKVAQNSNDKTYWQEVGAAWANKDGIISVRLFANPIDGQVVLFPRAEDAE